MNPNDTLSALAEVAAAFAGFSGVVAALGVNSLSELSALHRFRFANLLVVSVGAALFAFLPVVLAQFPLSAGAVWISSSALLAVFSLALLIVRWRAGRRLGPILGGPLNLWMALCWIGALSAVASFQLVNLLQGSGPPGGSLYVAGVFGLLLLSGLQFISLALPARAEDSNGRL
jgi:hypothetical protein